MGATDPFAQPESLISRVYAYVAYRLGPGADADDVTSDVFERALRYRDRYDRSLGSAPAWMIGIARRAIADHLEVRRDVVTDELLESADVSDLEGTAVVRLDVRSAMRRLSESDRELLALRYGADLTAADIGRLLEMRTNAVEVALHRALARMRAVLDPTAPPTIEPGRVGLPARHAAS